jgi:hypothetical protein
LEACVCAVEQWLPRYRETVAINERSLSIPSPKESARASPARPLGIGLSDRKRILGHALLTDLDGLADDGEAVSEQTALVGGERPF